MTSYPNYPRFIADTAPVAEVQSNVDRVVDTHTLGHERNTHKTVCFCFSKKDASLVARALNLMYGEPTE